MMEVAGDTGQDSTNDDYTWDAAEQKWIPRVKTGTAENVTFDGTHHVYTDKDGTQMFWDSEKAAWFPKIDEDFLARYQMSYGANDAVVPTSSSSLNNSNNLGAASSSSGAAVSSVSATTTNPEEVKPQGKRKAKDPEWFDVDEGTNTKVYVSNLPDDITVEEFVEFMSKCGLVAKLDGGKYNIKLYTNADGHLKGDGLCTYIKVESVDLALNILDGAYLKNKQVKVERAKFTLKGEFDPTKKPRPKRKKDKEKKKIKEQKLLSWHLDPVRNVKVEKKSDKIVIVSNAFLPQDFEGERVSEILEYSQDFREEAGKCGEVRKVVVHDRHPNGVVQINMSNTEEAQAVVNLFNNRFFGGRQIKAEIWDGVTKYHVQETEEEKAKREQEWVDSIQS